MTPQEVQKLIQRIQEEVRGREQRQTEIPEYRNSVRQLFEQVAGKVEHVISELLQNADDAGAKNAKISFEKGVFTFQHDGEDFSASQFNALCSFSVSDKHTIKTTGFRGIGFKSAFSLGDSVELLTPRFSVRFRRAHFTYPDWISDSACDPNWRITIRIVTKEAAAPELALSMASWSSAPSSLLFFGNLGTGSITIGGETFRVSSTGNKRDIQKNGKIVWSGEVLSQNGVSIPADAKAEIASLRNAPTEEANLRDTQIDLLIRKEERGRIYSVLPTSGSKRLGLSFAVNGSFVLKPDRDGITSPSQSPTNRFLFNEIGRFVVSHLLSALSAESTMNDAVLRAYELLPFGCDLTKPDAETAATTLVVQSCEQALAGKSWILTADHKSVAPGAQSLILLPRLLFDVWPLETLRTIFSTDATIVHPDLPPAVTKYLKEKQVLTIPESSVLLRALTAKSIPRPLNAESLFTLWSWCGRSIDETGYPVEQAVKTWSNIRIIPAVGSIDLKSLGSVFRIDDGITAVFAAHDIDLVQFEINVFDTSFIPPSRLKIQNPPTDWYRFIEAVGLTQILTVIALLERVTGNLISTSPANMALPSLLQSIWAIHIEFDVPISKALPILRRNGDKASLKERQLLVTDALPETTIFGLPPIYADSHTLAETWYPAGPKERLEFNAWLIGKEQAAYYPKPKAINSGSISRFEVIDFASSHNSVILDNRNGKYAYEDYVFDKELESYWNQNSERNPEFLTTVLRTLIQHHGSGLEKIHEVRFHRWFLNQPTLCSVSQRVPAGWVRFFASKVCMPDSTGVLRRPSELYIANASTALLISAGEAQLALNWQKEISPLLLSVIGCGAEMPEFGELTTLVSRELDSESPQFERVLNLLLATNTYLEGSLGDLFTTGVWLSKKEILELLAEKKSIPSAKGQLEYPSDLVQNVEDDEDAIPIHPLLRGSALAESLQISESPNRKKEIAWLESIQVEQELQAPTLSKLKKLIKHPSSLSEHLFEKLRRWPSLCGVLRSIDDLSHWHIDDEVLRARDFTSPEILKSTADYNLITPPSPRMLNFRSELKGRLTSEFIVRKSQPAIEAPWVRTVAQIIWTEADEVSVPERQYRLVSAAHELRTARLILDSDLAQRFYLDGVAVTESAKILSAWKGEVFAVNAADVDDLLASLGSIAKTIIGRTGSLKIGGAIANWVDRDPARITKHACKILRRDALRPWPSEGEPAEDIGKKSETPYEKPTSTGDSTDTPQSDGSEVAEDEREKGEGTLSSISSDDKGSHSQERNGDETSTEQVGHRNWPKDKTGSHESTSEKRSWDNSGRGSAPKSAIYNRQGVHRMLSYVEHGVKNQQRRRQQSDAHAAGAAAEEIVCEWEATKGRTARRLLGNHPGYDIESVSIAGSEMRYIEVKSIGGEWGGDGVWLSPTQFATAETLGDRFWLYVVEYAKSKRPVIHPIQNPAAHVSRFGFDCGWKLIANSTSEDPSNLVPGVGSQVLYDDETAVVEKVEKVGVFHAVTIRLADGTKIRKMSTLLEPAA